MRALTRAYRIPKALKVAQSLYSIGRRDRDLLGWYARLLGQSGEARDSLRIAQELTALDPMSSDGWLQQAVAMEKLVEKESVTRQNWLQRRPLGGRRLKLRQRYRQSGVGSLEALNPIPSYRTIPVDESMSNDKNATAPQ